MRFTLTAFLMLLLSIFTSMTAQEKTGVSLETDPSTFVFKGYAIHIRIQPAASRHFVFGAGSYGMEFPKFMVDMNASNKGKGWNAAIRNAFSLFGEYYFEEANSKWFVGLQTGIQNYKINNTNFAGESKYSNLIVMPSIGYTWKPFSVPIYFKPWFGFGLMKKISGKNSISSSTYNISPTISFLTMHVGYTF